MKKISELLKESESLVSEDFGNVRFIRRVNTGKTFEVLPGITGEISMGEYVDKTTGEPSDFHTYTINYSYDEDALKSKVAKAIARELDTDAKDLFYGGSYLLSLPNYFSLRRGV